MDRPREAPALERVLDGISDGFIVLDQQWRVVYLNRTAELMTRRNREEVLGRNVWEVLPEGIPAACDSAARRAVAERVRVGCEDYYAPLATWLSFDFHPLPDGLSILFQDITHRKRGELDNQLTQERLRKQQAALSELARHPALIAGELEPALRFITETASRTLDVERVGVWLCHDQHFLRCLDLYERSSSRHTSGIQLAPADYPTYFRALEEDRAIAAHDSLADPRTREFQNSYLSVHGITSLLDAPIHLGGQTIGVICHEHIETAREWSLDEQNFAGSLADLVALAIGQSERQEAALALHRANRALRTLSDSNRVLATVGEEGTLLREVSRIAVEVGGYRFAWIGYAEHDEEKTVRPMAQAGTEEGYLSEITLTWGDTERGRGPGGTVIRTGKPYVVRDVRTDRSFAPWRDPALQRGYASILVLPLRANGTTFGILAIYAGETNAFDAEEVNLLEQVAGDLAYGVQALRLRAGRRRAEAALEAAQDQLLQAEVEKKLFYRQVISAVSCGKLHLVEPEEIPRQGEPVVSLSLEEPHNYARLRSRLCEVALKAGMTADDAHGLVLAMGEAITNAIKHAGGGTCEFFTAPNRMIVRVTDHGTGIRPRDLPGALFQPGYSTQVSLGMGYTLMLDLADQIWLATGPEGTTVQIEKWIHPGEHLEPALAALLDRFRGDP